MSLPHLPALLAADMADSPENGAALFGHVGGLHFRFDVIPRCLTEACQNPLDLSARFNPRLLGT